MIAALTHPMPRRAHGFSLLEALIAIVIFSIGILSLVAAQAAAKQYASDAEWSAEAMHHASSLIAAMRLADQSTVATDFASPSGAGFTAWSAHVGTGSHALPGATTYPPTVSVAGKTVTVQLNWLAASGAAPRRIVLITELE